MLFYITSKHSRVYETKIVNFDLLNDSPKCIRLPPYNIRHLALTLRFEPTHRSCSHHASSEFSLYSSTPLLSGAFSQSCFAPAAAASRTDSGSVVRHSRSMHGLTTILARWFQARDQGVWQGAIMFMLEMRKFDCLYTFMPQTSDS